MCPRDLIVLTARKCRTLPVLQGVVELSSIGNHRRQELALSLVKPGDADTLACTHDVSMLVSDAGIRQRESQPSRLKYQASPRVCLPYGWLRRRRLGMSAKTTSKAR